MRAWLIWRLLRKDQRLALIRLEGATAGAHYVDLKVRREGLGEVSQADYLKVLGRLAKTGRANWRRA